MPSGKQVFLGLAGVVPAILLAAHPLLSLFEQNQSELPLSVIWGPLAETTVAIVVLYALLLLVFRSWERAAALTALATLFFFYFDTFKHDIRGLHLSAGWALVFWSALLGALVVLVVRAKRGLGTAMIGVVVAAAVLALGPAAKVRSYQHRHPELSASHPGLWATALSPPAQAKAKPDIYVVIPDDYARADILRQYFHYDNRAFARQLARRGFSIADHSRSPYSDSESNIAAELNMDYLTGLGRALGKRSEDVRPLKRVMEDSRSSRLAKALGYRYVHRDSDEVTFAGGNPHISSVAVPDSFTSLWLQKTVLRRFGGRFGYNDRAGDQRFRRNIRSSYSEVERIPTQEGGPKFVVYHTLMPHDPYIFGARGQSVTFPSTKDEVVHSELALPYYLHQVEFVEGQLLKMVDAIRSKSKRPPVIVIMADEGYESGDTTFGEEAMKDIRVKGILAISIPGARQPQVPQPPNTVNALRYVFNRVWGTHYPMLSTASYPEGDFPYQWDEKLNVH
jgi:hypothetical protein